MNAITEHNTNAEIANLDVVKFTTNNAYGIDAVIKIDHSNTTRYPIAMVDSVQDGGRTLILKGANNETASIFLDTDYDKFIESDKLVGRYVQFHTLSNNKLIQSVNDNNVVDILSVLPDTHNWTTAGSLRKVLEANEGNQKAGKVATIDFTQVGSKNWELIVHAYRDLYDKDEYSDTKLYVVTQTEYMALNQWLTNNGKTAEGKRADVRFKVRPGVNATEEAYDFEVLVDSDWVLVRTLYVAPVTPVKPVVTTGVARDLMNSIENLKVLYPTITDDNKADALADYTIVKTALDNALANTTLEALAKLEVKVVNEYYKAFLADFATKVGAAV